MQHVHGGQYRFMSSNGPLIAFPYPTWPYLVASVELHSRCFSIFACYAARASLTVSVTAIADGMLRAWQWANRYFRCGGQARVCIDPLGASCPKSLSNRLGRRKSRAWRPSLHRHWTRTRRPQTAFNLRTGCTEVDPSGSQTAISNDRQSQSPPGSTGLLLSVRLGDTDLSL